MAIQKYRLQKIETGGSTNVIHLETSSDMVIRPDGSNLETALGQYVLATRTINGKALNTDVQLSIPDDIALPDILSIKNSVVLSSGGKYTIANTAKNIGLFGRDNIVVENTEGAVAIGFGHTIGKGSCISIGNSNAIYSHGGIVAGGRAYVLGGSDVSCGDENVVHCDGGGAIGNQNMVMYPHTVFKFSGATVISSDSTKEDYYDKSQLTYTNPTIKYTIDKTFPDGSLTSSDITSIIGRYVGTAGNNMPNSKHILRPWTDSMGWWYDENANFSIVTYDGDSITLKLGKTNLSSREPLHPKNAATSGYIILTVPDWYAQSSIALGMSNYVACDCGAAIGYNLGVFKNGQVAIGKSNVISSKDTDRLIIGKGGMYRGMSGYTETFRITDKNNTRANAFRVTDTGVFAAGNYNASGADYAEMFEWLDANPNHEDRAGKFVTLDGDKLKLATTADDFILGVVSGNPSIVGDVYDDQWQGMYLYDIFGRPIFETVEIPEWTEEIPNDPDDPESPVHTITHPATVETRQKLNPNYNNGEKYIPRSERPEWSAVGMMGKLIVIDDGTAQINGYVSVSDESIATHSATKTKYRVMKRLDENHIQILIL